MMSDELHFVDASKAKYRFDEFNDDASHYLQNHGYVVIKNILNNSEINIARNLLWDFLESAGWDRNDYQSWTLGENEGQEDVGLFRGHGIAQSKLQWFIRKNKKVIDTFAKV